MEHSPEIPEIQPTLQQLFIGVLNEEYSAFFVCNDELTAGVFEQAASDTEVGRAELLDLVACEAISNMTDGRINTFLYGGLAFIKGMQQQMLDVNRSNVGQNITHWYIRLSRQDIAYLYTHDSAEVIERAYPISVRNSIIR